jgi:hypothetical protein
VLKTPPPVKRADATAATMAVRLDPSNAKGLGRPFATACRRNPEISHNDVVWFKCTEQSLKAKTFNSNAVLSMIENYCNKNSRDWLFLLAVIRCYLAGVLAIWRGFLPRTPAVRCFFTYITAKTAAA